MKNTFKYILLVLTVLAPVAVNAQNVLDDYKEKGGVATGKNVTGPNSDASYTITLETFATGESKVVMKSVPSDIVLVLDISQSMTSSYKNEYNALDEASYTPSQINGGEYYYLHTDGEYYRVQRSGSGGSRRIGYTVGNTTYYLSGSGDPITGNNTPTYGNNSIAWTGVLYQSASISRLEGLQAAVSAFLQTVYENDNYDDDDQLRDEPLGNRIAIVTYSSESASVTQMVRNLTSVTNGTGTNRSKNESILTEINAMTNNSIGTNYGTYSNLGMAIANDILNAIDDTRKENSTRTVVLFTDGLPGYTTSGWATNYSSDDQRSSDYTANQCVIQAATAKTTHDASVFTVALLGSGTVDQRMTNYMNYTSSNYPDAQDMDHPGDRGEGDYYQNATGADLSTIFTDIASQSGGSTQTIPASTQVRDVVSSSFNLPEGFNANSVVVYTVDVLESGEGWYDVPEHTVPTPPTETDHVNPLTIVPITSNMTAAQKAAAISSAEEDEDKVAVITEDDRLTIQGFEYSKGDGDVLGSGNWVGPRTVGSTEKWYGKKLVVEFNIKPEGEATGGNATNTNAAGSGVYIINASGQYESINDYDKPHTDLPSVIKIAKKGLRRGESATFQINRYRPIGYNANDPSDISAYEWTTVGKPKPNLNDPTGGNFTKVIITNKTGDETTEVIKTLMALDPSWVYVISEDDWAWSYIFDAEETMTTSDVEVNPFRFDNSKNTDAVKHAEAVSINHFANENIGLESRVENIKSNESFDAK